MDILNSVIKYSAADIHRQNIELLINSCAVWSIMHKYSMKEWCMYHIGLIKLEGYIVWILSYIVLSLAQIHTAISEIQKYL